ncbi:hypothetical protein Ocin01_10330 [Orchesella cincta]|uniref:Uncharacterized protein n=1 Tax=Orchesella cincta TaxID=48709 RepID=A0A1D2MTU2_ORCCI|nr:hypothetical protein Ocin01_10330 [Orchesella cincta]
MVCCCVSLRIGAMVIGTLGIIASVGKILAIVSDLASRIYTHLKSANRQRLFQITREGLLDFGAIAFELFLHVINVICGSLLVYIVKNDFWCPISATCIHSFATISAFFGVTGVASWVGINLSVDTTAYEFLVFVFGLYLIYGGYCGHQELMKEFRTQR